jgi:hypothetical protein
MLTPSAFDTVRANSSIATISAAEFRLIARGLQQDDPAECFSKRRRQT